MSTVPTPFQAKDGLYYNSYVEQREANIRHNEAALKAKGLDAASFRALIPTTKWKLSSSTPRRSGVVTNDDDINHQSPLSGSKRSIAVVSPIATPRRLSSRIRKQPALIQEDATWLELENSLKRSKLRKQKKQQQKNPSSADTTKSEQATTLSNDDKNRMLDITKDEKKWLNDMEAYLKDVEHLTYQNYSNVMRQVVKLVSGVGIQYTGWDDDVVFYGNGTKVTLADDFIAMYDYALEFENEHGRDKGNGWLLRHPIKKLTNFQRYCLQREKTDEL